MLAYTYEENGKFVLKEKEKPTLQSEDDAIVRVTLANDNMQTMKSILKI